MNRRESRGAALHERDGHGDRAAAILPFNASAVAPRIWLVIGDKLGDNQQVELIAERLREDLGWRVDVRRLKFKEAYRLGKPPFRSDDDHVDWSASDAVGPPWPDIVLTIGRRPSMVALWIKQQSQGNTHLVIVGRPRRWLNRFSLIIAAAHHHVPSLPNVLRLGLPLIRVDERVLATARSEWAPRFADVARPLVALFVGGPTKPHVFDRAVAAELMRRAAETVANGGTLWVTTSPRTSPEIVDALAAALPANGRLFRWRPGSPDNPYSGLLAYADRFIVTGDSVSMQVEVARLGKPLAIYPLPVEYRLVERWRRAAARIAYGRDQSTWRARAIRSLQGLGLVKFPRDVEEIHALLFERGFAVRLGEPFGNPGAGVDVDLDQIVRRIEALWNPDDGAPPQVSQRR
ncbi:MAG TPA: ELM1/GtrOC1 family putative glycosyltransferase [Pseudomonadales bacterium]|nr:ELM1/GtrOC1 family putative glycosyltransferase [Pseudomonadales bacterium]